MTSDAPKDTVKDTEKDRALKNAIQACGELRSFTAHAILEAVEKSEGQTEMELALSIYEGLQENPDIFARGWYEPPPNGVCVLSAPSDDAEHLRFDTLRKKEFWPRDNHVITPESIMIVYASPIDRKTGCFGDFGTTLYRGTNRAIHKHLARTYHMVEAVATYAKVGMSFHELYHYGQDLLHTNEMNNDNTICVTDLSGTKGFGHIVPWSDALPTEEERHILEMEDLSTIHRVISEKRIYIADGQDWTIPETCAFTVEARLEDNKDPNLPNNFYHFTVIFDQGEKTIHSNAYALFKCMGMDLLQQAA